jgi:hypothetical protein
LKPSGLSKCHFAIGFVDHDHRGGDLHRLNHDASGDAFLDGDGACGIRRERAFDGHQRDPRGQFQAQGKIEPVFDLGESQRLAGRQDLAEFLEEPGARGDLFFLEAGQFLEHTLGDILRDVGIMEGIPLHEVHQAVPHPVHLGAVLVVERPELLAFRVGQLQRFGDRFLAIGLDDATDELNGCVVDLGEGRKLRRGQKRTAQENEGNLTGIFMVILRLCCWFSTSFAIEHQCKAV